MHDFVILSDSACDLPRELRERFGVADYLRGILYFPNGEEKRADLDWDDISPEEFYGIMKDKKSFFRTAAPNVSEAEALFAPFLREGKDILMVTLSTGISAIYSICQQAAAALRETYPERKVVVVDSLRYSTSLSIQLVQASRLRSEGKTLEETAAWLEENKCRVHQMGPIDDLFFCHKMGRVSGAAAVMGTLVGIRPLGDFNEKGLSNVIGKAKGYSAAAGATVEYVKNTITDAQDQILFIAHTMRGEKAEDMKRKIVEAVHPKEVIITTVGQSCGPAIGPGLVAVFYYGKPISESLTEEKALMAKILGGK